MKEPHDSDLCLACEHPWAAHGEVSEFDIDACERRVRWAADPRGRSAGRSAQCVWARREKVDAASAGGNTMTRLLHRLARALHRWTCGRIGHRWIQPPNGYYMLTNFCRNCGEAFR